MGIDVGDVLQVIVRERPNAGGERALWYLRRDVPDFAEAACLMEHFNVRACVEPDCRYRLRHGELAEVAWRAAFAPDITIFRRVSPQCCSRADRSASLVGCV